MTPINLKTCPPEIAAREREIAAAVSAALADAPGLKNTDYVNLHTLDAQGDDLTGQWQIGLHNDDDGDVLEVHRTGTLAAVLADLKTAITARWRALQ